MLLVQKRYQVYCGTDAEMTEELMHLEPSHDPLGKYQARMRVSIFPICTGKLRVLPNEMTFSG